MTNEEYMKISSASIGGLAQGSQRPGNVLKDVAPIMDVDSCFKQAHELSSYVHSIIDRLIGAQPTEQDAKGLNYNGPSGLLPELVDNSRRARQAMQEAMGALRRLESQLP